MARVTSALYCDSILTSVWEHLNQNRQAYLLGTLSTLALVAVLMPFDTILHDRLRAVRAPTLVPMAKLLSRHGDFLQGTLPLCALVFCLGFSPSPGRHWRRVSLAMLLAATLAGLMANVIRTTVGRARPSAKYTESDHDIPPQLKPGDFIPPGFYGPHLSSRFHSFPSGHSSTAVATVAALAAAVPALTLPAIVVGISVPASRLLLYQHYPSDLVLGALLGLLCGLPLGHGLGKLRL